MIELTAPAHLDAGDGIRPAIGGLTVRDLAARLGWPHTTLSNYEVGRRSLPVSRLYEIAAALQRTPASLLIEPPEAAIIVDALADNLDRCLQVQMVLETLDDPLPEPVE
jgi:transcriptional regulator with XRE-family HTH domain